MVEIEHVINHLINRELHEASNYATRSTIKLRAFLKIAKMMDITLQMIYETKNSMLVDTTCSSFIEKLWKNYYNHNRCGGGGRNTTNVGIATTNSSITTTNNINNNFNSFPTSDEWATLERFLAKDFVRNVDLIRLAAVLKRRLPEKDLNFVFAVDGLYRNDNEPKVENVENIVSLQNNINDYRNYFENLSVPIEIDPKSVNNYDCSDDEEPISWIHVKAIRAIYKKYDQDGVTPEKIGKVLKKVFVDIIGGDNSLKNIGDCTKPECTKTDSQNSNSSSDSENGREREDNVDLVEKNIETFYRSIVGNKLLNIALWKKSEIERVATKEISRKRKYDSTCNDTERRNKPGRPPRKIKRQSSTSENDEDSEVIRPPPPRKMKRSSISENDDDTEVSKPLPPRKIKRTIENDDGIVIQKKVKKVVE